MIHHETDVKVDPKAEKIDPKAEEAKMADATKKADAALIEAQKADMAVIEAHAKFEESKKTPEEKARDKAIADADTKRAKANELLMTSRIRGPMSVETAKVMAPVPGDMPVSAHMAQKFGNDPENPKHGDGIPDFPESMTVRVTRKSPDHPELIEAMVHPAMVGDYERAGWNKG